jgi:hypothetical protein
MEELANRSLFFLHLFVPVLPMTDKTPSNFLAEQLIIVKEETGNLLLAMTLLAPEAAHRVIQEWRVSVFIPTLQTHFRGGPSSQPRGKLKIELLKKPVVLDGTITD